MQWIFYVSVAVRGSSDSADRSSGIRPAVHCFDRCDGGNKSNRFFCPTFLGCPVGAVDKKILEFSALDRNKSDLTELKARYSAQSVAGKLKNSMNHNSGRDS